MKKLIGAAVATELYAAGKTEDGVDFIAERYLVRAEYDNGERIEHSTFFDGCNPQQDPDDGFWYFEDIRPQALEQATKLARRVDQAIKDGLALNMDYWSRARPVYGSAAYSESEQVEWEREQRELGN